MIPFGPELIGQTEKTLHAILDTVLSDSGLSEREWVTLRLAVANAGARPLPDLVRDRAHFADAGEIVDGLTDRGFLDGALVTEAGHAFVDRTMQRIKTFTAPVFDDLPADDTDSTARILNVVLDRGRAAVTVQVEDAPTLQRSYEEPKPGKTYE
ncbi:hypothetical protein [Gordonia rhizosphera]|uniref:MarR family transcriptional regulator n=1 Tax=Gordonia rhizosphera NBRC 16068 TaxID=1108045 RepID=K6VT07_9ACTN|nr:hypothetical protein [Gordonia rhizosphera]GAB90045.1 hypothetical protein GORHZ_080_00250 [Gordonia rhizosphera NBRC 16068]